MKPLGVLVAMVAAVAVPLRVALPASPSGPLPGVSALIDSPTAFYTPGAFTPGFELGLYQGTNLLAAASAPHDAKLRAAAATIVPLCQNGSPPSGACAEGGAGRIGLAHIGFSVSVQQTCTGPNHSNGLVASTPPNCTPGTVDYALYQDQQGSAPSIAANVYLADCAQPSATMDKWASQIGVNSQTTAPYWYNCVNTVLPNEGLVANQIEAVTIEAAAGSPAAGFASMSALNHSPCQAGDDANIGACYAEQQTAIVLRGLLQQWPHLQVAYLYSRAYGGCAAAGTLNPEPYAYEDGFAVQFLIRAQIQQADNNGAQDSEAGNLSYAVAPVLSWGGYQWANGVTPNAEGLSWPCTDFTTTDQTHFVNGGYQNSANTMLGFFLGASATGVNHQNYTSWIRPNGASPSPSVSPTPATIFSFHR